LSQRRVLNIRKRKSKQTEKLKPYMSIKGKSIRPFLGSKDYQISRNFYRELGFEEFTISKSMSYFHIGDFGFYLQDAYIKDWIDNSMVFYEVEDLEKVLENIRALHLSQKFENVRLSEIVYKDWGKEFFLHDPSGILWHFGNFKGED
tara:strand:- start:244 stop:684 length:441 start_codon:yes stop_codon:yes gene_type:complete